MRKILHIDMNSFYVSVERAENPSLIGKPIAVAGNEDTRNGIILTASYELRKYGIKAGMSNRDAKKLYPNIILIQPRHDLYEKYSIKVMKLLKDFSPQIEQFSIDEAWVDVTGCENGYKNTEELAYTIKERIKKELKITASIGISYCKILAKLASDYKKPDAITIFMKEDIPSIVWKLPAKDLMGIGKKTEAKLAVYGINTIGDLANSNFEFIENIFGKIGTVLWMYANGIDDSPVSYEIGMPKSIGNSSTSIKDIYNYEDAYKLLLSLSESVGKRLRDYNIEGNVVVLTIKTNDFLCFTRQHKINNYINTTKSIYEEAIKLLNTNWNKKTPIRLLGISVTNVRECSNQTNLFSIMDKKEIKEKKLDKCMDKIIDKYGNDIIGRAAAYKKNKSLKVLNFQKIERKDIHH